MLDDGAGQAVEVLTVSEDMEAEHESPGLLGSPGLALLASPSGLLMGSPSMGSPPSPCVLATAHVCTRVAPPGEGAVTGNSTYAIVRRFEFSAEKQRNVVVVRKPDGSLAVYAKGSPEIIRKLAGGWGGAGWGGCRNIRGAAHGSAPLPLLLNCTFLEPGTLHHTMGAQRLCPPARRAHPADPASVPADFDAELARYTHEGLRVLGLASRELAVARQSDVQVRAAGRGSALQRSQARSSCWLRRPAARQAAAGESMGRRLPSL